ncbi:MAG TPA: hypothetical protein VFT22_40350 [Kofleriaceae bacterium]|nr:hypothetical protein [Kofleriaceae bacterium]
MKKVSNQQVKLVLKKDIIRALSTRDLTLAAGGSSERSISLSGCPACGDPL